MAAKKPTYTTPPVEISFLDSSRSLALSHFSLLLFSFSITHTVFVANFRVLLYLNFSCCLFHFEKFHFGLREKRAMVHRISVRLSYTLFLFRRKDAVVTALERETNDNSTSATTWEYILVLHYRLSS